MSRYAERTSVPVGKTKAELDALLAKHGATQRGVFEEVNRGIVMFTMRGRQVRLTVKLPKLNHEQESRHWSVLKMWQTEPDSRPLDPVTRPTSAGGLDLRGRAALASARGKRGPVKPHQCFPVDRLCKVRVYANRVEAFDWLQLFARGESGFEAAAW